MFIIFRQDVVTTRLKHVFDIEFIQEIPTVKQVFMNWDTDSPNLFILFCERIVISNL